MDEAVWNDLRPLLEDLRSQLAVLSERVERLEQKTLLPGTAAAAAAAEPSAGVPRSEPDAKAVEEEGISEEVVIAISAAVAAFLGVRARVRQIRLITSPAWAQQGRVSIQASHRLF
jgi:methylmalonyl-CoA carboxyltransferase large subunit